MTPLRRTLPVLCVFSGLAAGCLGGSRPEKAGGSALWLTSDSAAFDATTQRRLSELGTKEIYLDAAELDWNGGVRLHRIQAPAIPRRTPATLVISGRWLSGDRPPEQLATALLSELSGLRIVAEQDGLLVAGFHFEVEPGTGAESYANTLKRLRSGLGKSTYLSASLDRRELEGPQAQAIADAVDYFVCMIYGQRPGEAEDPTAWDLQAVEENFRRLEALDRPYFIGAVTMGTATLRGRSGETKATSTAFSLRELIHARNLELKPGFSLQGIDRQVWEFVARRPGQVGEWSLATGDSIRVVRTATPFLEELRRRIGASESPNRLGEIYYRLRRENERLSLSVDNLADVLAPDAAAPALELAVEKVSTAEHRWLVKLRLANRSSESTDLAYFDSNFVQLEVAGATIGGVEPGEFQRFELLADGEKGTMRSYREANAVRFFLPLVEEHQEAASGSIELKLAQRRPTITLSANFLLADGKALTVAPREWQFDNP